MHTSVRAPAEEPFILTEQASHASTHTYASLRAPAEEPFISTEQAFDSSIASSWQL
jgi:hypothetical protein